MIFHRIILSGYPTSSKVLESIKSTVTIIGSKCTGRQAQRQRPKMRYVQLGHAIGGMCDPFAEHPQNANSSYPTPGKQKSRRSFLKP